MLNLPVYLYPNSMTVLLDLDPTTPGVYQVMYKNELKLQKALKNVVSVQFKNSDQKRINIYNTQTFVFSMFDATNNQKLIEKQLTVLDDGSTLNLRGLAQFVLTESDTKDLNKSFYNYSIKVLDNTGSYVPAYADTYYGVSGTIVIDDTAYPVLQPSTVVDTLQSSYNQGTQLWEFKTRAMPAHPEFKNNQALHTIAYYMTNFVGTVKLQVTMDNDPDYLDNWSTIDTRIYTIDEPFSGIDYLNFNGVYSWVNVLVIPEKGPLDLDNLHNTTYRGTFDKVVYRC
jgi:hypothetical protein